MSYYPPRNHTEVEGIDYPDASHFIRAHIRTGWKTGYHYYDEDLNNNFLWASYWIPQSVEFRRDRRPPWFPKPYPRYLYDPQARTIPEAQEHLTNEVVWTTPLGPIGFAPWPGVTCYCIVDNMIMCWTGESWRPFMTPRLDRKNVEIAIFATNPKKGKVFAKHSVEQPFTLYANSIESRVRGYHYMNPDILILKNGEEVGTVWKGMYSSGILMAGDVLFEAGDMMELVIPATAKFVTRAIAISIVGGLS